jgi:hypothetical protein
VKALVTVPYSRGKKIVLKLLLLFGRFGANYLTTVHRIRFSRLVVVGVAFQHLRKEKSFREARRGDNQLFFTTLALWLKKQ